MSMKPKDDNDPIGRKMYTTAPPSDSGPPKLPRTPPPPAHYAPKDTYVKCPSCGAFFMAYCHDRIPICPYCGVKTPWDRFAIKDGATVPPTKTRNVRCPYCHSVFTTSVSEAVYPTCPHCQTRYKQSQLATEDGVPVTPSQPPFVPFDASLQMPYSSAMLDVGSEDGPLTVVSRAYHLDDPHQRREFEIDVNARKWAEAVWKMWERFGSERDEQIDREDNLGRPIPDRTESAAAFQRAIAILNEELESRGLDLEASCG